MSDGGLPTVAFPSMAAWQDWLAGHGATSPGVWLKIAKKSAAEPTVSYPDALEVALCFGWIDGQKRSLDEQYWLQRLRHAGLAAGGHRSTCRRPRS